MNDPIARPVPVADLVDYQPGSVVSRVLLRTTGGVMTVFAFAEGEGLSAHSTPHQATVLILEGRVRITIGDDTQALVPGQILHLPPSIPHSLEGETPFKMLLTLLKDPGAE